MKQFTRTEPCNVRHARDPLGLGAGFTSPEPNQPRQIYHQGFLDDACFPYAVANAYKALTGKKVGREQWKRGIPLIPEPAAFLGGSGATQLNDDEVVHHVQALLSAFSDSGEGFALDKLSPSSAIADLCAAISPDSVVVFAFGGPTEFQHPATHVVCGVAASENPVALHIACSAAFSSRHLAYGEYIERHHPHLRRYSNDSIPVDNQS